MKNHAFAAALCMLISVLSSPAFAFGNGNGTAGSPHDFALQPWNGRAEICRVCHVPHDHSQAEQRYTNGLL